jgi:hypothetical protein
VGDSAMESLDSARQLRDAGRYREALKALDAPGASQTRTACTVLKAEVLERLGQNAQAHRASCSGGRPLRTRCCTAVFGGSSSNGDKARRSASDRCAPFARSRAGRKGAS